MDLFDFMASFANELVMTMFFLVAIEFLASQIAVLFFIEMDKSEFLISFKDAIDGGGIDIQLELFGPGADFIGVQTVFGIGQNFQYGGAGLGYFEAIILEDFE